MNFQRSIAEQSSGVMFIDPNGDFFWQYGRPILPPNDVPSIVAVEVTSEILNKEEIDRVVKWSNHMTSWYKSAHPTKRNGDYFIYILKKEKGQWFYKRWSWQNWIRLPNLYVALHSLPL